MAQSSILVESSFNSKAELGVKIAILLVPSLLWRMHSALYYEKKVVCLVKLVVIMIINDSNSKRGVSRGRRWMFCLCAIERHLQVVQWEEVWVRVGYYASVLTSQGQSTPASLWHLWLPAPSGENALQFWAHTPPSHLKNNKEDTNVSLFRLHHIRWELSIKVYTFRSLNAHIYTFFCRWKGAYFYYKPQWENSNILSSGCVMAESNWHSLSGIHCQCLI